MLHSDGMCGGEGGRKEGRKEGRKAMFSFTFGPSRALLECGPLKAS